MSKDLQIRVAEGPEQSARRFVDAWHRTERGKIGDVERHVSFETFDLFVRTMSPKRLELLRHLHRHPAKTIRAPAQALDRDDRRVHQDVEALAAAGLLERDKDGLHAAYETFEVQMRVAL